MWSAYRRRETLIALRATHTAHRIVNEIRYPELSNVAPADPVFASLAPVELEALRKSIRESRRTRKIDENRRADRSLLLVLGLLIVIRAGIWISGWMLQNQQ